MFTYTMKTARIVWSCFIATMIILNTLFIIDLTVRYTSPKDLKMITQEPHEGPTKFLTIKVLSSRESVSVAVDGLTVYAKTGKRGLHIVVLNHQTGQVMTTRIFDTYVPNGDRALPEFLESLSDDRIVCFAILDEATFSLTSTGKDPVEAMGSKLINSLKWRDTWAFVTVKGKDDISGEDVGRSITVTDWGNPVNLHVHVAMRADGDIECYWKPNEINSKRKRFCSKYEGYKELCNCGNPYKIPKPKPLSNSKVADIPVIIIASNRPMYLYRTIKTLLTVPGVNSSQTVVFVDGLFQEPVDVANVLGVKAINHEPSSQKNGRISQNYKASLTKTFDMFPRAKYVIILEEDLEVAPDFFSYFSQTVDLLEKDPTIYCISAWNDQGYSHSCKDPTLLYRVETMPGLGWLLSRQLYKNELEPQWPHPDQLWDWDMWMRTEFIRKGRECIIPDVSRTYHFGESGLNINPYFQDAYFKKHSVNKEKNVELLDVDRMTKDKYEEEIMDLLKTAIVLDHTKNVCARDYDFIPNTKDEVYVMFISMEKQNDYETWMQLAKCFHLWDLDARGFHKGLWRFWLKQNQIMVVGVPYSPYKSFKPDNVEPIKLKKKN